MCKSGSSKDRVVRVLLHLSMADISDIIASVTREQGLAAPEDENQQRHHDLQLLTRAWVAERTAPELLPYPSKLVDRIMGRVQEQVGRMQQ